jgi:hypothetical protein
MRWARNVASTARMVNTFNIFVGKLREDNTLERSVRM